MTVESTKNKNLPIGGGLWSTALFHPEDAPATPFTEWNFDGPMSGMSEAVAPKLGKQDNPVSEEVGIPPGTAGEKDDVRDQMCNSASLVGTLGSPTCPP
jgi:hypothetical protein